MLAHQRASVRSPLEVSIYNNLILFHDYYVIVPFAGILLAALVAPVRALGIRVASWCGHHVWALATITALGLAVGSHVVYHAYPLSLDEHTVVFQSKIFAAGRLSGYFPPELIDWLIPQFFQGRFFGVSYQTGDVVSAYWPGFSLLLTPFTALGYPWLLNPLIGAATVLLMHRLATVLFEDPECAGYVALLTLASPAVTVNAISYYSMPAHFLANGIFLLLLLNPSPLRALAAGFVGSVALVLHNPVPHMLFALPWIVWLGFHPARWRLLGALVAGYLPVCLVLGWGWSLYIENLRSPSEISDLTILERASEILMRRLTGVLEWTSSTGLTARFLDLCKLWLWASPALIALAFVGAWHLRRSHGQWMALAGSVLLTYFGYFLGHFDQGHGWGFRYFHSAWLALPLFAVLALRDPPKEAAGPTPGLSRSSLPGWVAGCAVLSLVILTTLHAFQVERFITRHIAQLPVSASGELRAVIINPASGYFSWDLVRNDPFLRDPFIVLLSRGPQTDQAMMAARFPQYTLLSSDARGSVWGVPQR